MSQRPRSDAEYIDKIQRVIATNDDLIKSVRELEHIAIPQNPSILIDEIGRVVHGGTLEYEESTTYDYLDGEALNEKLRVVAQDILKSIFIHLENYKAGNSYHREYEIVARYEGKVDGWFHSTYTTQPSKASSFEEASRSAKRWLYAAPQQLDEKSGYGGFEIETTYVNELIRDKSGVLIATHQVTGEISKLPLAMEERSDFLTKEELQSVKEGKVLHKDYFYLPVIYYSKDTNNSETSWYSLRFNNAAPPSSLIAYASKVPAGETLEEAVAHDLKQDFHLPFDTHFTLEGITIYDAARNKKGIALSRLLVGINVHEEFPLVNAKPLSMKLHWQREDEELSPIESYFNPS